MIEPIYLIIVGVVVYVLLFIALLSRYRRCPADKILVVCGPTTDGIRCLNRGGVFIWPFIQEYSYLSLTPVILGAELRGAFRKNVRSHQHRARTDAQCRQASVERIRGTHPIVSTRHSSYSVEKTYCRNRYGRFQFLQK